MIYHKKTKSMIHFEIKSKVQPIGERKGQTVYYAHPKSQQQMTHEMVVKRIVNETSLSEGDVSNALISLSNVVCDALQMGMSVDLAELGRLRLIVSSKMMDKPEDVTVAKALNTPKIVFTPKQKMRDAANAVELSIDQGTADRSPRIEEVYDLTSREKNRISRSSFAEVNGRRILLVGAGGVGEGEITLTSVDSEYPTTVEAGSIKINTPEKVVFKMVDDLTEGEYILTFKTYYDDEGKLLDEPRTIQYEEHITLY